MVAAVTVGAAACGPDGAPPSNPPSDARGSGSSSEDRREDLASFRFTADTLDGGTIDTAEFIGHEPVAFWVWAPWCPSCNREAPTVREAVARHGAAIRFVGVAGRDETGRMQVFVDRHKLGDMPHAVDRDGDLWPRLGVYGQPAWVLVDRAGNVHRLFGLVDGAVLDNRLRQIAGVAPGPPRDQSAVEA